MKLLRYLLVYTVAQLDLWQARQDALPSRLRLSVGARLGRGQSLQPPLYFSHRHTFLSRPSTLSSFSPNLSHSCFTSEAANLSVWFAKSQEFGQTWHRFPPKFLFASLLTLSFWFVSYCPSWFLFVVSVLPVMYDVRVTSDEDRTVLFILYFVIVSQTFKNLKYRFERWASRHFISTIPLQSVY